MKGGAFRRKEHLPKPSAGHKNGGDHTAGDPLGKGKGGEGENARLKKLRYFTRHRTPRILAVSAQVEVETGGEQKPASSGPATLDSKTRRLDWKEPEKAQRRLARS